MLPSGEAAWPCGFCDIVDRAAAPFGQQVRLILTRTPFSAVRLAMCSREQAKTLTSEPRVRSKEPKPMSRMFRLQQPCPGAVLFELPVRQAAQPD